MADGYGDFRNSLSGAKQDHFAYQLNVTLPGPELADKLERIAFFLKGENKQISVKLVLEAEDQEAPDAQAAAASEAEPPPLNFRSVTRLTASKRSDARARTPALRLR